MDKVTEDSADDVIAELQKQLSYERETNRRLRQVLADLDAEREDILSIRDYAIGVEQELGTARHDLEQRDAVDHALRKEIIETHAHLADAIADSQAAHRRLAQEPTAKIRRGVAKIARKVGLR